MMLVVFRKLTLAFRLVLCAFVLQGLSLNLFAAVSFTSTPSVALQPAAPLSGLLTFDTDVAAKVSYRIRTATPGEGWLVETSSFETSHSLPLLSLTPDTPYIVDNIQVMEIGGMTNTYSTPLPITTAALPGDFPLLDVRTTTPNQVEPGYTYIPFRGNTDYSMALDSRGNVRWYIEGDVGDMHLSSGLLLGRLNGSIVEMDFLGNIHRSWHSNTTAVPLPGSKLVNTNQFHHDVRRMPSGNFLTISREEVVVDNFPTDPLTQNDPNTYGTVTVRDQPIVEFDPNGTIVNQWNMLDMLDKTRLGYGTFRPDGTANWIHMNAVTYDPSDDSITFSARLQDAVVKFDRATGDLIWILGDHANWSAAFQQYLLTPLVAAGEDFVWPYHQHAPMYLPTGNLMLFDNHNFGASPPDAVVDEQSIHSRALEYEIDPNSMTITQVWEYGTDDPNYIFARATGDADWMPITDNVLITYGIVARVGGTETNSSQPRIIEVDRAGNRLFEVVMGEPGLFGVSYRSEKFPSLYGSEYAVTFIPEPSTLILAGLSLVGVFASGRRKS